MEHTHMHRMLITLALAAFAAGPTSTSAQTPTPASAAVMATVQNFVAAFNKGDTKAAAAVCAEQTSIIDEFPPYEWHGIGACAKWMGEYDADAKKNGITDGVVTLGKPSHVDVTVDRAYVVVPANYTYQQKGAAVSETGSILSIALQKVPAGWRMTGWAWAKH